MQERVCNQLKNGFKFYKTIFFVQKAEAGMPTICCFGFSGSGSSSLESSSDISGGGVGARRE